MAPMATLAAALVLLLLTSTTGSPADMGALLEAARDVLSSGVDESLVTPTGEGFDERLIRTDGREPTRGEVERYRREGRFASHYSLLRTSRTEARTKWA